MLLEYVGDLTLKVIESRKKKLKLEENKILVAHSRELTTYLSKTLVYHV